MGTSRSKGLKQFILFGIVGVSNTLVSYVIYIVTLKLWEHFQLFGGFDYLVSSVMGFVISVLWSFYWNNRYTFKQEEGEERSLLASLLKTYISYAFSGLLLSNVLLMILVEKMGVPKEIAPILCLLVTVPINYVMNKFWAFRTKNKLD